MQSATAVTFILVSMVATGLIDRRGGGPIVIWCNVGLTALAFVTTFDIHPIVAWWVGCTGILLGLIRQPLWNTIAGALLGLGLILFGLEQMGAGAAPLKNASWFQDGLDFLLANPFGAFAAGFAAAVLLQSNTGATMLVIALTEAGAMTVPEAIPVLYGTNLGAIPLRFLLSSGLNADGRKLVRLEDLFCLWSGILMMTLLGIEQLGVPLIAALAQNFGSAAPVQLAIVFFLSNFLPAATLTPALRPVQDWLERVIGRKAPPDPGKPEFLHKAALEDPSAAIGLLEREMGRLLEMAMTQGSRESEETPDPDSPPPEAFTSLSESIESYAVKIGMLELTTAQGAQLHQLRAMLSVVRHVEETARYFLATAGRSKSGMASRLQQGWVEAIELTRQTLQADTAEQREAFRKQTRSHGPIVESIRRELDERETSSLATTALFEDFAMAIATLHRLAKLLERMKRKTK